MQSGVKALQAYLQATSPTAKYIALDGVLGEKTVAAYTAAVNSGDVLVSHVASKLGVVMPKKVPWTKLKPLIESVSARYNIPQEYFDKVLRIENRSVDELTLLVEYEGTHRGIGQFDKQTWSGAFRSAGKDVPDYETGVIDDATSMEAIALLYLDNKRAYDALARAISTSTPFTLNVAYLYHNQGAPRSKAILTAGRSIIGNQSGVARTVVDRAIDEVQGGISA